MITTIEVDQSAAEILHALQANARNLNSRVWAILLIVSLALCVPLQRRLDAQRAEPVGDEALYVTSGRLLKSASLGCDGLLADLYWLRAVRYFGTKLERADEGGGLADLGALRLELLAPLLNVVTELDPHYTAAYRFGAAFLPAVDAVAAVRFVERGLRDNPAEWQLHLDLGLIHWRRGNFSAAGEAYARGGRVPGAPAWLPALAAMMMARGGDRETAREIFTRLYENSTDEYVKQLSLTRLKSLRAQDELELLNRLLSDDRRRRGACPASWAELIKRLPPAAAATMEKGGMRFDADGAPLDPDGFVYALDSDACAAALARQSTIAPFFETRK